MVSRLIESFLIQTFNSVRKRPPAPLPAAAVQPPPLAVGEAALGHEIPGSERIFSDAPAADAEDDKAPWLAPDVTAAPSAGDARRVITIADETRRRHLYAIGSTGCGKTNLLLRLIEADIAARRSFCVVDLRGDLVDRVLLRLAHSETAASLGKRLLLLDLRDADTIVPFNPLMGDGDPYNRAFHMLEVLKQQLESWGVQLDETLRNSLLALAEAGGSLLDVEPLLTCAPFRQEVLGRVTDSRVRAFFDRYGRMSDDRQSSWYLPVFNKITPLLAIPQIRLMLGRPETIPLRRILDHEPGAIVLVSLAVDRLHGIANLVGGLFISAFQNSIMARVDQPEDQRVPVHLYVDEFETMATQRFEAIIAEGRRFGLGLTLSHQNLTQLPTGLRQMVLNNVHTRLFFQTGASDAGELSKEVAVGGGKLRSSVTAALLAQKVGEAVLARKGQAPCQILVIPCPDPVVSIAAQSAVADCAKSAYGAARAQVERQVAAQEERILAMSQDDDGADQQKRGRRPGGANPAPAKGRKAASPAPTYVIRHVQDAGEFSPKEKKP
ncbi:hypothetical protein CCAX7_62200 [Capsulimonas corticalis]|uniref:Uncharacterized protein n=1 Tax=Capsulimonas corticalis TaxID=2219043 RepID=A0A402CWK5_9BACT|nr:type IV secretion system DNA-binding domain-containing protein [Capsulimonas corticalis]BDI34169.1 hypothetical protein CCAX7_62200 [Capsulimonas corticalis]